MGTTNRTRRALGTRGGVCARAFADYLPEQMSFLAGVPHLDGDRVTAIREFAERAYPTRCVKRICISGALRAPHSAPSFAVTRHCDRALSGTAGEDGCAVPTGPAPYEDYTPVLYAHDGSGFHVVSPEQILVHAQHLVERQFHRDGPLVNNPHIVRAMLQLKLCAHPQAVFAAFLLTKRLYLMTKSKSSTARQTKSCSTCERFSARHSNATQRQ
jgi:hypothetical protein